MSETPTRATVSRTALFGGLPAEAQAAFAAVGEPRHFSPGSVLMHQGDPSDSMYVILRGLVRVERVHPAILDPLLLAELGAGEVAGEMGVLDDEPRTATVTAITETDTLRISDADLGGIILKFPEVSVALLHILSRRLRSTDELATQLHESSDH